MFAKPWLTPCCSLRTFISSVCFSSPVARGSDTTPRASARSVRRDCRSPQHSARCRASRHLDGIDPHRWVAATQSASFAAAAPESTASVARSSSAASRPTIGSRCRSGSCASAKRCEAGRGVEQHDVAHRTRSPRPAPIGPPRRCTSASLPEQRGDVRPPDAEIGRIEVVLGHRTAGHLPDVAVAGSGELVDAVVTAVHERGRTAGLEDADHEWHPGQVGHPDRRRLRPRRVAERVRGC